MGRSPLLLSAMPVLPPSIVDLPDSADGPVRLMFRAIDITLLPYAGLRPHRTLSDKVGQTKYNFMDFQN